MDKITRNNTKLSGEHFVKAEFIRRGLKVEMIPTKGNQSPEMIVTNLSTNKIYAVQIRTSKNSETCWILHKKAEDLFSDDRFYAFVNLNETTNQPTYHIVPSAVVAKFCQESHAEWLKDKKRNGDKRTDSTMRKFYDNEKNYLNTFDLFE